jgi:hypothetical protein
MLDRAGALRMRHAPIVTPESPAEDVAARL